MQFIMDILAVPLGYVLWFVYRVFKNYFVSIFLFTLLIRLATFPLSLKAQKTQAERAKIAPRLERLQKKYAKDPKKLQEKQMALYEKEGVSPTAGCLPTLIQMVVLFGVIAVIYAPMTHLARFPSQVVSTSISAIAQQTTTNEEGKTVDVPEEHKLSSNDRKGYYKELHFLMAAEYNHDEIVNALNGLDASVLGEKTAEQYYEKMIDLRKDFNFFGRTLLEMPWTNEGFKGISILWLIPLFSGLTALASSLISMKYLNMANGAQQQPGQGCSNNMMIVVMPLFSLFIAFTVPGGVGVYWICSNIIAVAQTLVLNSMYNPVKIRAQAEVEYEELRRRKQEDKKRLAEARAREEAEERRLAAEEAAKTKEKQLAANTPKAVPASKNPNKLKRREANDTVSDSSETSDTDCSQPVDDSSLSGDDND